MEFIKALKNIQNKGARKKGVKAYYNSGQVYFSRLFGYERVDDRYVPIPKHAVAIKMIYQMLIDGESIPAIKAKLDSDGFRDSSNNKYSIGRIIAIAERPIYAGYLQKGWKLTRVNNVEPIVSLEEFYNAKKRIDYEKRKLFTT